MHTHLACMVLYIVELEHSKQQSNMNKDIVLGETHTKWKTLFKHLTKCSEFSCQLHGGNEWISHRVSKMCMKWENECVKMQSHVWESGNSQLYFSDIIKCILLLLLSLSFVLLLNLLLFCYSLCVGVGDTEIFLACL